MNNYYFHSTNHMGDSLMNLRFFYNNRDILKKCNIKITYYYSEYTSKFLKELQEYQDDELLTLLPISDKNEQSLELWMGHDINGVHYLNYSVYYDLFYKAIQKHLQLESVPLDCSFWQNEPHLHTVYDKLPECYKDVDILINNCEAFSYQYNKSFDEMNALCQFLNTKYRIVTTRKVSGVPCTGDHFLKVKDIAAIGTHAKNIIGIMSGPLCALNNKQTRESVNKWFIITTDGSHYIHSIIDYTFITNGDLSPIYYYFSKPTQG